MFKLSSFEDELYRSMQDTLVKNQSEATSIPTKLAKATTLLSDAAAIFKQAGMLQEAKWIAEVLDNLGDR